MGLNCRMDPALFGFSSMIYGVLMPTGQTLQLFLTPRAASYIAMAEFRPFSIPNCRTPSPPPQNSWAPAPLTR